MSIAYDNSTTDNTGTTSGGVYSFSYTVSGSNRILFVSVVGDSGDNVTGVTYNSVAMTLVDKQAVLGFGSREMYLFYLIAPATGANNVTVSAPSGTGLNLVATSYTGAKQSGQPDSNAKGTQAATTSFTQATTTVADNCWLVGGYTSTQNPVSGGTATTIRTTGTNNIGMADSNGPKTPAGSKSLIITTGSAASDSMIVASFSPAPVVINGNFLAFM